MGGTPGRDDGSDEGSPFWGTEAERRALQQRLEEAADLVGWLAHAFGNVLTGVLGFASLGLAELPPGTAVHGYLGEIRKAARQGQALVSRLLAFSRRTPAASGPTDVAGILAQEVDRRRAQWAPSVELSLQVPAGLPRVAIGPEALRQVLSEVLENAHAAVKPAGTVKLSARALELSPQAAGRLLGDAAAGPMVEVAIEDDGRGLAHDAWRRFLSEPFFSTKPRHRGLGLPVVYGLLRTHRGGFRIERPPEHGTVVRLMLPTMDALKAVPDRSAP